MADEVATNNDAIQRSVDNLSLQVGEIAEKLDTLHDDVAALPGNLESASQQVADYSQDFSGLADQLNQVAQLLSYTDLLMVVLIVFMVFGFGGVLGSFLLKHFRS